MSSWNRVNKADRNALKKRLKVGIFAKHKLLKRKKDGTIVPMSKKTRYID